MKTSRLSLSWTSAAAAAILSLVAATGAIMHYRTFQAMESWTYTDILEARADLKRTWYRPVAILAWCVAGAVSILNIIVSRKQRVATWWLPPAVAITSVLAASLVLLVCCLR
jgi:hypothetical protein